MSSSKKYLRLLLKFILYSLAIAVVLIVAELVKAIIQPGTNAFAEVISGRMLVAVLATALICLMIGAVLRWRKHR